jgi:hypothetical protein
MSRVFQFCACQFHQAFCISSAHLALCRSDEYVANTLVLLDYYPLTSGGDWSIEVFLVELLVYRSFVHSNVQVSEALTSKVIFSKKQISSSGRFSFVSSSKGGDYVFCFQNLHSSSVHRMSMTLKHGVDATDYDRLMKSNHLTAVETDFTRMIDQALTLRKDIEYYKDRERESRNTSESTCERALYFSIVGILVTCVSGFISFWETKKEFKRHKYME